MKAFEKASAEIVKIEAEDIVVTSKGQLPWQGL